MPTYPHRCVSCSREWDVQCRVADRDEPQRCPACDAVGDRQLTVPQIDKVAAGSWNQASYNPALGCWTDSWKHGRQIAKSRGMVEVGDEPPEKIHARAEKQREETREQRWKDADRVMKYD